MKKIHFLSMVILVAMTLSLTFSCSKDDDGGTGGSSSGTNTNGNTNPNPPVADIHVVVNKDGTTSNGSIFTAIDDKNFYVDYIKYTLKDGYLFVSGYDTAGFKGDAKIVSSITYNGNTYSVISIGEDAFAECSGLTSVTIPNSVTLISYNAFYGCSGLTSITIPNSVASIGDGAFRECSGLTSITIPNSVTSICKFAFSGCSGLTSITIPNSVASIGVVAFGNCSGLTSVIIEDGGTVLTFAKKEYPSEDWQFEGCPIEKLYMGRNVSYYNYHDYDSPFKGNENLATLTIGNRVTSIGNYAFYGCSGLTSVTIGNSVTSIGEDAFRGCIGLTSLTIPNSVTSIGEMAFRGCSGLTSVIIPKSVTSFGSGAFANCSSLTAIHWKQKLPQTFYDYRFAFDNVIYKNATLYVPKGSLDAYKSDYGYAYKSEDDDAYYWEHGYGRYIFRHIVEE